MPNGDDDGPGPLTLTFNPPPTLPSSPLFAPSPYISSTYEKPTASHHAER